MTNFYIWSAVIAVDDAVTPNATYLHNLVGLHDAKDEEEVKAAVVARVDTLFPNQDYKSLSIQVYPLDRATLLRIANHVNNLTLQERAKSLDKLSYN